MVRIGSIILGLVLLIAPLAAAAKADVQLDAKIDQLVRNYLLPRKDRTGPPALSIVVGADGSVVTARGFGEARSGVPATTSTIYRIGSLTKQFTAAAMLKLIEDGVRAPLSGQPLTLDTPLREIFEDTERWSAEDQPPITVRRLLSMTSNLPNFTRKPPRGADPWGAVEVPQLIAALKREVPHGWPDTFEYSNTNYFLLGQIIEASLRGAGDGAATMRGYIRNQLLNRASLRDTGFAGERSGDGHIATPHYRRRPAFAQPHWLDGCADMESSAVDLFGWNKALMQQQVLLPESTAAMFSDAARVDPMTYYGMGWYVAHEEEWDSYHHSGSVPGYTSYNAIERRRDGAWQSVTILTNSDGVEGLDVLADEIFRVMRDDVRRSRHRN
jgi:CubicO group peptidase (beta-lactamase class C family)